MYGQPNPSPNAIVFGGDGGMRMGWSVTTAPNPLTWKSRPQWPSTTYPHYFDLIDQAFVYMLHAISLLLFVLLYPGQLYHFFLVVLLRLLVVMALMSLESLQYVWKIRWPTGLCVPLLCNSGAYYQIWWGSFPGSGQQPFYGQIWRGSLPGRGQQLLCC